MSLALLPADVAFAIPDTGSTLRERGFRSSDVVFIAPPAGSTLGERGCYAVDVVSLEAVASVPPHKGHWAKARMRQYPFGIRYLDGITQHPISSQEFSLIEVR